MKIYELVFDEDNFMHGVNAISLVENPAMENNFVTFSKAENMHRAIFKSVDDEKRIIMGAVLIPDKAIMRVDPQTKEEFYVYFTADTIRKVSQYFLMRGNQNSSTLAHEIKFDGGNVIESWVVDDPAVDKSAVHGFDVKQGTWMASMKITNNDVWKEYVKTGNVKGFSIEGYFDMKQNETNDGDKSNDADAQLSLIKSTLLEYMNNVSTS